jgi:hypothetical protein
MNDDVDNRPYDIPTGKRILTICILTFLPETMALVKGGLAIGAWLGYNAFRAFWK